MGPGDWLGLAGEFFEDDRDFPSRFATETPTSSFGARSAPPALAFRPIGAGCAGSAAAGLFSTPPGPSDRSGSFRSGGVEVVLAGTLAWAQATVSASVVSVSRVARVRAVCFAAAAAASGFGVRSAPPVSAIPRADRYRARRIRSRRPLLRPAGASDRSGSFRWHSLPHVPTTCCLEESVDGPGNSIAVVHRPKHLILISRHIHSISPQTTTGSRRMRSASRADMRLNAHTTISSSVKNFWR